jgi:hypothetical protein
LSSDLHFWLSGLLLWLLSAIVGYWGLYFVWNILDLKDGLVLVSGLFLNWPLTLFIWAFWAFAVFLVLKMAQKKPLQNGISPRKSGLILATSQLILDLVFWGMIFSPVGLTYYSFASPWIGYVFLYFYTERMMRKYNN